MTTTATTRTDRDGERELTFRDQFGDTLEVRAADRVADKLFFTARQGGVDAEVELTRAQVMELLSFAREVL